MTAPPTRSRRPVAGLVLYLTVGDPVAPELGPLVRRVVAAGADAIELGVPTRSARPRGDRVGRSFARAGDLDAVGVRRAVEQVREAVPDTPVLVLAYPATQRDLGLPALTAAAARGGADSLVLAEPAGVDELHEVHDHGLDPIPVIGPDTPARARSALESAVSVTYLPLATTTGAVLDRRAAAESVRRVAADASRPFVAGFGLRAAADVTALGGAPAGVVVGSRVLELLEGGADAPRGHGLDRLDDLVRSLAAALLDGKGN